MQVFDLGSCNTLSCDLSEFELKQFGDDCQWVVYWYEIDLYEGSGQAVSLHGDQIRVTDLGHCSWCGPTESIGDLWEGSVEEFLKERDSIHDFSLRPEIEQKVMELLGACK